MTFAPGSPYNADARGIGLIEKIELNHGPYSWNPPYQRLEVYGSPLTSEFRNTLGAYGFDRFKDTPGGFAAIKSLVT
jgi:hypothetical protein